MKLSLHACVAQTVDLSHLVAVVGLLSAAVVGRTLGRVAIPRVNRQSWIAEITERIAEELIKIFARVSLPKEILTDQGRNFTSQLLAEIYWLFHVQTFLGLNGYYHKFIPDHATITTPITNRTCKSKPFALQRDASDHMDMTNCVCHGRRRGECERLDIDFIARPNSMLLCIY